ncbi:Glucose-methanol-choline oxidoreductase [Macrophomina phaseolina MS6]|uniref:Glucose-methanol-choline oxidoreductase n=1 Tax=Macrophomina phaseolina (strain MS6) TaxID=1126212 RepID=K2RH81_MACPH|nr:Glucose-methanol-choline oxidoreductase [Macrophomina phaseolina MS6]
MRSTLSYLLFLWAAGANSQQSSQLLESYDYIICGGGTSGLTVANRLTELADATVLVIEAGPESISSQSQGDWRYPNGPERFASGRSQTLPAGKVLGGSSVINGQVYLRAEQAQIDDWERAGNTGWNWATLFPYYLKSEQFAVPNERQTDAGLTYTAEFHGTNGPVNTGWPTEVAIETYLNQLEEAYASIGMPRIQDPNGGEMRGLSTYPRTRQAINDRDVRESAASAYYEPVRDRTNLDVLLNTSVLRIVWAENDDADGNAIAAGVEVATADGTTAVLNATQEVILAAGAYRSASILEYSGVGNSQILQGLGIATKVYLPGVGEHLMDQANNILTFEPAPEAGFTGTTAYVAYASVADVFGDEAAAVAEEVRAALPDYAATIAAQNNNATSAEELLPLLEIQYTSIFETGITAFELLKGLEFQPTRLECEVWSTLPFSRGNVHITTARPPTDGSTPALAINNNYFQLDYDNRAQIAAARFVRNLYALPPLNGSSVLDEIAPGLATVPPDATDDEWEVWLKGQFRSAWHPVGTTSMLPRQNGGVVDAELKVYETANVRIVDAGVFPFQINGHPSATVYAVAERAADIIKQSFSAEIEIFNWHLTISTQNHQPLKVKPPVDISKPRNEELFSQTCLAT